MADGERPLGTRLSIFERPQVEADVPPDPEPSVRRWVEVAEDPSAIRLALEQSGTRIYLVPRSDDQISTLLRVPDGGGASTWSRSVLDLYGAKLAMHRVNEPNEWVVYGVVPDRVWAVRVDGRDAVLGSNTFLVHVPQYPERIVLAETDGERTLAIPPPPQLPDTG